MEMKSRAYAKLVSARLLRYLAGIGGGLCLAGLSTAATYDLSQDFSLASNPNGVWSYGWVGNIGGPFTPILVTKTVAPAAGVSLKSWQLAESLIPAVYQNDGTATWSFGSGNITPGTVWFHPGENGRSENYGVIRFIVPIGAAGNYDLRTAVQPFYTGGPQGDTDFHVVKNGSELFGQFLTPTDTTGYTNELSLVEGDTVDFIIGRGQDGNAYGSALKIAAALSLIIHGPPNIVGQPQDLTVTAGQTATFTVTATGTPPLTYQWSFNGTNLPGATQSSLVLANVQFAQAGDYSVAVSNSLDVATSDVAVLTVQAAPPAFVVRGPYLQAPTTSNLVVRWRTDPATDSRVRFGLAADNLVSETVDAGVTTEHSITLNGLAPDTKYFYAIGSTTDIQAGGAGYFFTTPPAGPKPTRIWAIGDSGTASLGSTAPLAVRDAYAGFTAARPTDVWLMLGDNAYFSGTDAEYQTAVFDVFQQFLRTTPLWSTIGNHETYGPGPGGALAYFDIFTLPQDGRSGGVASGSERYYGFDYGDIHFVCLDSELSDNSPTSPMVTWLEEDLAANTKEWLIAFWHSPPYSKGSHNSDLEANLVQMRESVVPLLESYGVDLVLCGHSHSYERSFLLNGHYGPSGSLVSSMIKDGGSGRPEETGAYLKNPTGDAPGAVYVVAGSAGQTSGGQLDHPAMFVSLNRLGSMVIDVVTNRMEVKFLRETGGVDDHFTIIKATGPPTIVSGPASQTVTIGGTASFSVAVVGTAPFSYQWRFNGNPLPGETDATLELSNVQTSQAGDYSVRVANAEGFVISSNAVLIAQQPAAFVISGLGVMGTDASGNWSGDARWNTIGNDNVVSFYVAGANLTDPFLNGPSDAQAAVSIPLSFGTHTFSFFLPGGNANDRHGLNIFFNGDNLHPGISAFAPTRVTDTSPPFVVNGALNSQSLAGQTVPAANSLTFSADNVIVTLTEFYVAADSVYNLDRVGFVPFGQSLVGSDGLLDRVGQFTVNVAPTNNVLPPSMVYDLSPDFSLTSNPNGVWSYGWAPNTGGPFTPILVTKTAAPAAGVLLKSWQLAESLTPAVYQNGGTSTWTFASGSIPPGTVWLHPGSNGRPENYGVIRFTVPAGSSGSYGLRTAVQPLYTGSAQGDTDFHVLKNGSELFGQFLTPTDTTGYTNELPLAEGDTIDFVIGRGQDGNATGSGLKISAVLSLLTNQPPVSPSIAGQPQHVSVAAGQTATFMVTANGTPPLTYQWRFNGAELAGATQSSLVLANVQPTQAGDYSVVVANAGGSVTSSVAVLTVTSPPVQITYDLSRDYSLASNPNGVWSYGYQGTLDGGFKLLGFAGPAPGSPAEHWSKSASTSPDVYHNGSLQTLTTHNGQGTFPPGTVWFLAGYEGSGDDYCVVRFTLPTGQDGLYRLETAAWRYLDGPLQGDTDFHLLRNEVELAGQFLAPSDRFGYTNTLALVGGETIDFAIGRGQDNLLFGSALKIEARLTLMTNAPPVTSTVRVVSVNAAPGGVVGVPVQLLAQGNENALGFSLNFNTALLSFAGAVLGGDAPAGATLIVNDQQAGLGRVGLAVALAADATFNPGTQQVMVVNFNVALVTNAPSTPVAFDDAPTARQVSDPEAHALAALFTSGSVSITAAEFEGDVAPRPEGDRNLTITDWVQLGRFAAGLDTIANPGEFQRADCAPRADRGNGLITVTDWVQAGRYAVGLDPLTPVGGPIAAGGGAGSQAGFQPASGRTLGIMDTSIAEGLTNIVPVTLECAGNENALGFTVAFDAAKLRFVGVEAGAGAGNAALNVNASQAGAGRIGVALALPPGATLAAGTREIIWLRLAALATAPSSVAVAFEDAPVARETSDSLAGALTTAYASGTITVTPPPGPPLNFTRLGNTVYLSWPVSATGFVLESSSALNSSWSPVSGVIVIGDHNICPVSIADGQKYFRLKKP